MQHNISSKVIASTLGAAIATLICWGLSLVGVDVPVEAQGAIVVIVTFISGYLKVDPDRVA